MLLRRISQIESLEQIELERQRESLRDRRWRRHRNEIFVGLICMIVIATLTGTLMMDRSGSTPPPDLIKLLQSLALLP